MTYAERFASLLAGLTKAYGKFTAGEERADGKRQGRMVMVSEDLSEERVLELWEKHLSGEQSIGIVPIREDNSCFWGAIDIDDYQLDLKSLAKQLKDLELPMTICRSKSGGAHIYLFMTSPIAARKMQNKLREIAAGIGQGQAEIFPKQTKLLLERGDRGNCLNMPYFAGDNTTRYALDDNGDALSVDEFLERAESHKVTHEQFKKLKIKVQVDEVEWLEEGPPCLVHLAQQGFPQGTRNNGLFNIGVYLKRRFPDDWHTKIEEINRDHMQPPLAATEILTLQKTLKNKEYGYRCNEQPLVNHCNSALCRTRKYGIGSTGGMPMFGTLSKFESDPPIWFLDVEDGRLELETEDLQNQQRFQRKCMNALNRMPPVLKPPTWQQVVQQLLDNVELIEVSNEVSTEGQFHELLESFCTDRSQAKNKDEIMLGKPWSEDGYTYFRLKDLQAFLTRNNFKDYTRTQITARIIAMNNNDAKAAKGFFNIKGKGVNLWRVPEYALIDGPYTLPETMEESPI
jgi:hypothetical protein